MARYCGARFSLCINVTKLRSADEVNLYVNKKTENPK